MHNRKNEAAKGTGQPTPKSRGMSGGKVSGKARDVPKASTKLTNPVKQYKKAIR